MPGKVVALIAPTRSGKSFLAERLSRHYKAPALFEVEPQGIPKEVSDGLASGTATEPWLYFRNRCVSMQHEARELTGKAELVFVDSTWVSCPPYIGYYSLSDTQRNILESVAQLDRALLPWPDLLVYLKTSDTESERLWRSSNQEFEQGESYFRDRVLPLKRAFDRYLSTLSLQCPILAIDRTGLDFERAEDLSIVTDEIDAVLSMKN